MFVCVCGGECESHFAIKALGEKQGQHQRDQRFVSLTCEVVINEHLSFFFLSFFSFLFFAGRGNGGCGWWTGAGGVLFCNFPCRLVRYIIFGFISLFIFLRLSLCNNFIFH